MRWRNGGGWTRELLCWPQAQDWRARVTVADIEADGPFSKFPGVRRWFCPIQGDAVELRFPGETTPVRMGADSEILLFDGQDAPDCVRLGRFTRNFNLMVQGTEGLVRPLAEPLQVSRSATWLGIFSMNAGTVCWAEADGAEGGLVEVPAMSLVWTTDAAAGLMLHSESAQPRGWWLSVS